MDIKHKGISWVGNVCQKFEAVCQEVDNIISQDTVKYVEHRVNSASQSVKKFYSDVVQDLLPPTVDPVTYDPQAVAQRESVVVNAYFKSLTCNKENVANSVATESSVGLGANSLINIQPSQASSKITFVNEEGAQVSNPSVLELNGDFLLGKNDDVLIDKDIDESIIGNAINELPLGNSDGTLIDKHSFMELDAVDPLKNSLSSVSGKNDVEYTNEEANSVFDDFHLPVESSIFPRHNDDGATLLHFLLASAALAEKNDRALADKDLNKSPITVRDAIFEPDATSYSENLPSHACNGISFTNKEAVIASDSDGNHLQLESELRSGKSVDALANKISNESLKNETPMENGAHYPLKNQQRGKSSSINYQNEEFTSVSNDSLLMLKSELFEALMDKKTYASLKERATSSSINYQNEEFSSVSNDSLLKLESELFEDLMDREIDASLKERANLEFSTKLTFCCDKESVEGSLYSEFYDNACKEDIVTLTGDLQATSDRSADAGSNHKVGQASSMLVNSLINFSPQVEITSDYFTNETSYSSSGPDPTSELDPLVLTCGKIVEELRVTSASCGNESLEMRRDSSRNSSSMQPPVEDHASGAHGSAFLPELCTSSRIQFPESTNSVALSFSDVGCSYVSCGYIPDADLETVDLRDEVKPKDYCDIVDYKALHAVSRRTQKLCSYKKRIQDAFTSRRRLAKEYEQLAIFYGDTDLEFNTDSSQKLPFSAQAPLDSKNVPARYASDSEWELL